MSGALFRNPDDWAKDNGWISRRRAKNLAKQIEAVAREIDNGARDNETVAIRVRELRAIAKAIAPATTPAQRRMAREKDQ